MKQAVNRNIERFPEDFMFKLTKDEASLLMSNGGSQFVIPTRKKFLENKEVADLKSKISTAYSQNAEKNDKHN